MLNVLLELKIGTESVHRTKNIYSYSAIHFIRETRNVFFHCQLDMVPFLCNPETLKHRGKISSLIIQQNSSCVLKYSLLLIVKKDTFAIHD